MKRMFLGLLLLFAVGILACGPQSNDNTTTPNANATPSPKSTPTFGTGSSDASSFGEVVVTIVIADDADKKPYIASVTPDPADVTGRMRVQWLVDNQSKVAAGENATVEIGPFKGQSSAGDSKPFGPDACANSFALNFLKEGKQSREISEPADFQSGETGYTYEVVLKAEDGSELSRYQKRPEIIVSGMVLKPTPSPTPKPSPTAKPRT